ncbi:MAG: DNA polymerase III subunit alpha [Clostridia bacterium]|nr:DNA polymerase III subunit alpha [Clostridia bacterium]
MAFTHLHMHSEYSLLDGANRIGPMLDRIKALGMDACAITDHGALYGVIDFYNEAMNRGIHPVIGCELYLCPNMDDKNSSNGPRATSHLIVLCENQTGYQNLIQLVSDSWIRGYYYRPRVDLEALKKHHEGLIASSACLSGRINQLLLDGRYDAAIEHAKTMEEIFGKGNFFIELMDHGLPDEKRVLPLLIRLSNDTGIPMIVTNDCHYLTREDAAAQEILMCIQTGKTLNDEKRMRQDTDQLYIKSEEEMHALFPQLGEAIERTHEIAMRCQVSFTFGETKLPRFETPHGETSEEMLRSLCEAGLKERYHPVTPEARERLDYELSVISRMGYVDYFLIVWDFIHYARSHGIVVGPGRGSGAGSIVAYCLSITQLDPLRYSLLFERFLNPERVSMPDIDVDFCYERRQEVIDYVARKYGSDHVSQIITFGTMAARAVVRDVGRVLGYPFAEVNNISKLIPYELGMTLEHALKISPELSKLYKEDPKITKLIDMSLRLEGLPRHTSTHAAGVLITDRPLTDYIPLQRNDDVITSQYPMGTIEKLGLLKVDFLGLRTLTVIRDALEMMKDIGISMNSLDIPMDDPEVYKMISNGDTDGVFQLESAGMRSFLSNMRPQNFEDIIAAISLYRPGPMDSIPVYIKNRKNPEGIQYLHESLRPILSVTYGCIIYQEQVMQIVRDLAGYSYGRSDLVRRAMAKKKHDVMAKEREIFIHGLEEDGKVLVPGCVRNGISEAIANQLFDEMTAFASYAFNKSHAAAYGVVAVQTAWLKRHYPVQFFAAILNSVSNATEKMASYLEYCRSCGISILPPDINKSQRKFSVDESENGPGIRFGLGAIKSCGEKAIDAIIREREIGGRYTDIFNFCTRMSSDLVNKRAVESLIVSGSFDCTGAKRAQLFAVYEQALESASKSRKNVIAGQLSFFDDNLIEVERPVLPDIPEFEPRERLALEKSVTGLYISGHPLSGYTEALSVLPMNTAKILELKETGDQGLSLDGTKTKIGGLITEIKQKATKNGQIMAFLQLEDMTGSIEVIVFARTFEQLSAQLVADTPVIISGRLSIREDEPTKLILESIDPLLSNSEIAEKRGSILSGNTDTGSTGTRKNATPPATHGAVAHPKPATVAYGTDTVPAAATLPPQEKHADAGQKMSTDSPVGTGNAKLWLSLPDESAIQFVTPVLARYKGKTPVMLYARNVKKILKAPDHLSVTPGQFLFHDLIDLLGEKNVVLKEEKSSS